jgi:hypothetical protein
MIIAWTLSYYLTQHNKKIYICRLFIIFIHTHTHPFHHSVFFLHKFCCSSFRIHNKDRRKEKHNSSWETVSENQFVMFLQQLYLVSFFLLFLFLTFLHHLFCFLFGNTLCLCVFFCSLCLFWFS